ncbi:MAG: TatD family hydrolase [Bacteroidaceae bacterium]|nr:TatD family hydrolase [Bacteroidaceae bacterium]
MNIIDIHTHVLPEKPGTALVCIGCGPIPLDPGHYFSAGLHPWDVTEGFDSQLDALEKLLANPRVLAVGECGFDALKGPSHDTQEAAFIRQVEISEHYGKPMILHVVRDFDSVIRLRKQLKPKQQWLIHGFRGGPEQMNQLYAQGILVSFGQKHNSESLKAVPADRLYLETDGNGSVQDVIQKAAQSRNESPETIVRHILRNNNILLER